MRKAIELMTQRATNIMQQIAEDIAALMNMPQGVLNAQREQEWVRISNIYQRFAAQNNLPKFDLDQFKECVLQQKRDKLKEELMRWGSEQTNVIELAGPLENLSADDVLIAIGHIHTLVVANLLIEFLRANGAIN